MAASDYKGATPAAKAKFLSDLADPHTNPTPHVAQWLHRCNEWARGTYPRGITYADLRWMAEQCVKELHKRDPKSTATMDGFPPASAGREAAGPSSSQHNSAMRGLEIRCQAGQDFVASCGQTTSSGRSSATGLELRRKSLRGEVETRILSSPIEIRDEGRTHEVSLVGMPIVYAKDYFVHDSGPGGGFTERMEPGVASHLLGSDQLDCKFLYNHSGMVLGRTKAGTLKLEDSPEGLRCEVALDTRSAAATDVLVAVERGDLSAMSCAFTVDNDTWSSDMSQRSIRKLRGLFDVSAVSEPASPTTHIAVKRSQGDRMTTDDLRRDAEAIQAARARRSRDAAAFDLERIQRRRAARGAARKVVPFDPERAATIARLEQDLATARNWGDMANVALFARRLADLRAEAR